MTANGNHVATDVAVASGGVIDVTDLFKVDGNFDLDHGGALGVTIDGPNTYSQVEVGGAADLDGALNLTLASGFTLASGDSFDVLGTGDGLTNDLASFSLDGRGCGYSNGAYNCWVGAYDNIFTLDTVAGNLVTGPNPQDLIVNVTVRTVPEPASWAMMLAGFAGLGFAGWRRATARAPA